MSDFVRRGKERERILRDRELSETEIEQRDASRRRATIQSIVERIRAGDIDLVIGYWEEDLSPFGVTPEEHSQWKLACREKHAKK